MAKAIMLQGTMSNAGKSLLAAALCRIFAQDGLRAAPFKSQNMALNSYVTAEGLEMGRAQVMQAEAAGAEPSVRMNPILLKPTTHVGSQVIVNGIVRGDMRAMEYFRRKKELIPEIMAAYRSLAAEYDVIVLEGAGSPVELNLKAGDIVNMGMARLANAPVLLVGDIDRGGVFPQLLGTLDLLEPQERANLKGLIVNKFRGDRALFADGVDILERRGGVPVLGVVPWMDLDLDEEDSLSDKLNRPGSTAPGKIDIAVVRLPRISNYTDFDVFSRYENVNLRYVTRPSRLGRPDLLLLPGTKSTIADMGWLAETGMAGAIRGLAGEGVPVFGICGGYQLLGGTISDPAGAEGGGQAPGLGLLDMDTRFSAEKTRAQVSGTFASCGGPFQSLSGAGFTGYEIHMGETDSREAPLILVQGRPAGAHRGNIYGCYVHGIFDHAADTLVEALCRRRGMEFRPPELDLAAYRQAQYDKLAAGVRESLDMGRVYDILEEGAQWG